LMDRSPKLTCFAGAGAFSRYCGCSFLAGGGL
jgi:hypothetical protein